MTIKNDKKVDSFNLNYHQMFNISLFSSGIDRVLTVIDGWLASKAKKKWVATINPEFVMASTKDKEFQKILQKTDLNVVDGVGLIWAKELDLRSSIMDRRFWKKLFYGVKIGGEILKGKYREGLVTGVDLMDRLCGLAIEKKYKIFFLGGFNDRAKRTAKYFENRNKGLMVDWCEGEPVVENKKVIEKINKFRPDILFVAYGMKKQEEWIYKYLDKLDIGVAIGVGRSFDYYSGDLKRAPKGWRKMGLEWLYSLIKEPKRLKRQLELPKFVWKVIKKAK